MLSKELNPSVFVRASRQAAGSIGGGSLKRAEPLQATSQADDSTSRQARLLVDEFEPVAKVLLNHSYAVNSEVEVFVSHFEVCSRVCANSSGFT